MSSSKRIEKICPETLLQLVRVLLDCSADFKYIDGIQPFMMSFKEKLYYVYIKNVSNAYFEDRSDTTRAQLPVRAEFDKIKESPYPFIFLGYDSDNDVLICWNYHVAKKRLNAASSVSFYSRTYFQEEVKSGEFLRKTLKNGDTPVLFKRKDIVDFFENIETFFIDENHLKYKSDYNFQESFEEYIVSQGLSESTCYKYSKAIEGRVSDGISRLITKEPTNLFYYANPDLLKKWMEQLFNTSEYKELDSIGKNMYSCAFDKYIQFQMNRNGNNITSDKIQQVSENKNSQSVDDNRIIESNSKLLRIVDEDLLKEVKPLVESNRNLAAVQIVGKYYDGKYPNMTLSDWMNLVKSINAPLPQTCNIQPCKTGHEGKRKNFILRVCLPDGRIIQEQKVSETLLKVVLFAGVSSVQKLNINVCGDNMIVSESEINPRYRNATKYVADDLYVNTCSDTNTKYNIINKISESLSLGLSVNFITVDNADVVSFTATSSSRSKIRVEYPNGDVIQHSKVLDTLIDVIKNAGVANVHELGIRVNHDNLVTTVVNPMYETSLKPLGDGNYVHTNSGTNTKLEQIGRAHV